MIESFETVAGMAAVALVLVIIAWLLVGWIISIIEERDKKRRGNMYIGGAFTRPGRRPMARWNAKDNRWE